MKAVLPMILLGVFAFTPMVLAAPGAISTQERFKTALNQVVQKVRAAETPAGKRAVMNRFFEHMETGIGKARTSSLLDSEDKTALSAWQETLRAYAAELNGQPGHAPIADADLDAFAGFMQQQMEQARWGGGIYISAGALLVIILLLILLY